MFPQPQGPPRPRGGLAWEAPRQPPPPGAFSACPLSRRPGRPPWQGGGAGLVGGDYKTGVGAWQCLWGPDPSIQTGLWAWAGGWWAGRACHTADARVQRWLEAGSRDTQHWGGWGSGPGKPGTRRDAPWGCSSVPSPCLQAMLGSGVPEPAGLGTEALGTSPRPGRSHAR